MNPTHKGFVFGIIPVYLDMTNPECPGLEVRRRWLEWTLDIVEGGFSFVAGVVRMFNPDFEPMMPIWITEEIGHE